LDERFYSRRNVQAGFGPAATPDTILHTHTQTHHDRAKPTENGTCGTGMEPAELLVTRVEAFSLVQWRTRPEIALASTRCVGACAV